MAKQVRKFDADNPDFVNYYTGLFSNAKRNHKAIFSYLRLQSENQALFYRLPSSHRADVKQEALLRAMQKIDKYRPDRGSPIDYFNKVIDNAILKEIGTIKRNAQMVAPIGDNFEPRTFELPDGLAAARTKAVATRSVKGQSASNVIDRIKYRIEKSIERFNLAHSGERRDIWLILATLQDVLFDVAGSFVPIRSRGIRYTDKKRIDDIGA